MIKPGMYVRCPYDSEDEENPRDYVIGIVRKNDELNDIVLVHFNDPFQYRSYYDLLSSPEKTYRIKDVMRCQFYKNTSVLYKDEKCIVDAYKLNAEDNYYYYYLTDEDTAKNLKVCEKEIEAPFTSARVDPAKQLQRYEFQNPCWLFGRTIVKRTENILDHSLYGFKELSGNKIFLKAYQLHAIMRCFQSSEIRYMLADEVGLGKTIEAISILKLYLKDKINQDVLITVPGTLVAQWKTELLLKFYLSEGENLNGNIIHVKSIEELNDTDAAHQYTFVIVDEVHKYLRNDRGYSLLHQISRNSENVLLLSATPVHQRGIEYLSLLRLLLPEKYDGLSLEQFENLLEKQKLITQSANLAYTSIGEMDETIKDLDSSTQDLHDDEDCRDIYDEMIEELQNLADMTNDEEYQSMLQGVRFENDDFGVEAAKLAISYICENYQFESHIIRNRRQFSEDEYAARKLIERPYSIQNTDNYEESFAYSALNEWIQSLSSKSEIAFIKNTLRPLLCSFFSSPWAYIDELKKQKTYGVQIDEKVLSAAEIWLEYENSLIENLNDSIDEEIQSRIINLIDFIECQTLGSKFLIFTDFKSTMGVYYRVLKTVFDPNEVVCFAAGMDRDQLDQNVYRFQNGEDCHILISDKSGGEGRNLQSADYIIHIDLPWDANEIEQRIGRLDRIGRDPNRPVYSVVPYAEDSFEQQLFKFWNEGLNIFEHSLSGLEIISEEINETIVRSIADDYQYGIYNAIPELIEKAKKMREQVRSEQIFDTAAYIYKPLNTELDKLVRYYNDNENELFTRTMLNWASLAGFHGEHVSKNSKLIRFDEHSFSTRSARNSMLIPPNWSAYLSRKDTEYAFKVQNGLKIDQNKYVLRSDRQIIGTFDRQTAIENDFVHFYAPGDEIFDCIINNAVESAKGQSCAVALRSQFNWKGFIFTYSITPDEYLLLENNVPLMKLNEFRHFLPTEDLQIPITVGNVDEIATDNKVIQLFNLYVNKGYFDGNSSIEHLGRRGRKESGYLDIPSKYGVTNIEWFKWKYPENDWATLVATAKKVAHKQANHKFYKLSRISEAESEIKRIREAKKNSSKYFSEELMNDSEDEYDIVLKSIKEPKITLESACFVWMVKDE